MPPPSSSPSQTPSLLPSPLPHPSEAENQTPSQVQATSASIYSLGKPEDQDHVEAQAPQPAQALPAQALPAQAQPAQAQPTDEDDGYPPPLEPSSSSSLLLSGFRQRGDAETSFIVPASSSSSSAIFHPLFTLISDSQTNESYHPSVHYIFSDDAEAERDGHDLSTIAALRSLDRHAAQHGDIVAHLDPEGGSRGGNHDDGGRDGGRDDDDDDDGGIEERYIFVDLRPTPENHAEAAAYGGNLKVKAAASLSPAWAVTSASLRGAPTLDGDQGADSGEGMMLLVEGVELDEDKSTKKKTGKLKKEDTERKAAVLLEEARKRGGGGGGGGVIEGMAELWKGLGEGLDVLESIIGHEDLTEEKT